jgi:diphthamide synthase (EF-2-diphthine--ammonia ligase)
MESYHDIFNFSKEKIEQELHIVLDYYLNDLDKFDVMNIDLLDQARTFVERKKKREEFMKSLDSEHQRIVDEIIESLKKHKKNVGGEDIVMSEQEKEVREIAERFGIKVNRVAMGKESHKGYNKCKDNDNAFIFHKKGSLFPKKGFLEPHEI